MQVYVLDLAFSRIPDVAWVQRRKAEGVVAIFQDVWTGGYVNNGILREVAAHNLRMIREGGLIPCIYTNASPWRTPELWFNESIANIGSELPYVKHAMIDIEISADVPILPANVNAFIQMWKNQGMKTCSYSADWYVGFWKLQLGDANAVWNGEPYIHARYDLVADYNVWTSVHPLGPLVGKQYRGSHTIEGVSVDASTIDSNFFEEDNMTLSPAAEAGIEAFFATPYTDMRGRTFDSFATFLKQVINWLDNYHLKALYDALGVKFEVNSNVVLNNEILEKVRELTQVGEVPQSVIEAIEEIRINLNNPPLAAIAKAVNDELARRQQA